MDASVSPMVSIILCFYNEQSFLAEAVESVIAQTYSNWELILVDDGSSDRSTSIAREYARKNPRKIICVHHPGHINEGLSASRNLGISVSKGEFVALIDADDIWLPEKLSAQLDEFKAHPDATVVMEASEYWNSWSDGLKNDVVVKIGVPEGVYRPPYLSTHLYPLGPGFAPCPCGIMMRRSVVERHEFEESFRGIYQMYEDQAFLGKVYLTENVFVSHKYFNRYRQRPESLVSSVSGSGKYHTVRSYYLQWFWKYIQYKGCPFPEVKQLVKRQLMQYREPIKYKLTTEFPRQAKSTVARWLVRFGLFTYSKA